MSKGNKKNAIQYLYGETNEIELPVMTVKHWECDEIAVGDPIHYHKAKATTGRVRKALPWGYLANASAGDARRFFAGISMSQSKDGDSDDIRVATDGVFEFPCTSNTYYPGYTANVKSAVGTTSASVDVDCITVAAPSTTYANVFGTVVNKATVAATTVKVRIASQFHVTASIEQAAL